MVLSTLPTVERLTLARVTAVPEWHPEHATFAAFPVHAWVVRHREGNVLLDTGIGVGHESIDEWYRPEVTSLSDALAAVRLEIADIAVVVLSHLHFDHCGQQGMLGAPVYVQTAEHEAAQCAYRASELRSGLPAATNLHDPSWRDAARESLG